MKRSGYAYIYCSNESETPVFFDNFMLTHSRGRLLEETHYYPFGLSIAALTSRALKANYAENKNMFNGGNELQNKEFSDGSGLEMYDARFRMLDPQLGRFQQHDPLADFAVGQSVYGFSSNNPMTRSDPWGLTDTVFHGEVVQRDKDLPTVTVTAYKKPSFGGFYWPSYTKSEVSAWRNEQYRYDARRQMGQPAIQGGESKLYLNNIASYKRRYEAEEDGRKMSLGAVVAIAAPIVGPAIGQTLLSKYGWSFTKSLAINLLQNGGNVKNIDLFDVSVNALNPFRQVGGIIAISGVNSLVDFLPFRADQPVNFLGSGKNIGQVGLDFSFGTFSGAASYIFGTGSAAATITDIATGSASAKAQDLAGKSN